MEMELDRLIEKIKREGVEKARGEAGGIIDEARAKAEEIVGAAEKEKAAIIKEGEDEARRFRAAAEKALKQAARDVLLTLRERVIDFSHRIVKGKVSEQLTQALLKDIIVKAIANCDKDGGTELEVIVSKDDRDKLEKAVFGALSQEMRKGITIKGSAGIEKGFRMGEKGTDSYIDFTDEAIAEAFRQYLNPKLVDILDVDLWPSEDKGNAE